MEETKMDDFQLDDQDLDFYIPGVELLNKIGQGSQGSTYKAIYKEKFACVKYFIYEEDMEKEVEMLQVAQKSGCVPEFFEAFLDEYYHVIIMELVKGKDLFHTLKQVDDFPSYEAMHSIIDNLIISIKTLHSTGVIHNDIKLDNIMVDSECKIKIIDLGLATFVGESPAYSRLSAEDILTYSHVDPSLADGGRCSEATDMYSLKMALLDIYEFYGCSVYEKYAEMCSNSENMIILENPIHVYCENCNINFIQTIGMSQPFLESDWSDSEYYCTLSEQCEKNLNEKDITFSQGKLNLESWTVDKSEYEENAYQEKMDCSNWFLEGSENHINSETEESVYHRSSFSMESDEVNEELGEAINYKNWVVMEQDENDAEISEIINYRNWIVFETEIDDTECGEAMNYKNYIVREPTNENVYLEEGVDYKNWIVFEENIDTDSSFEEEIVAEF